MANGAPSWLIAVPCRRSEALHDPASHGPQLRDLSAHDKREIVSLAAVAVVSTLSVVSIGMGIIGPARVLDAPPPSLATVATPVVPVSLPIQTRTARAEARRHSAQSAQASRTAAEIAAEIAAARRLHGRRQIVQASLQSAQARKAPGPLKRVLFGSGEYRVQPFPMIGEEEN